MSTDPVHDLRAAFPGLREDEAYLDTAATALKPDAVLDALRWAYTEASGNVHRGAHRRSAVATEAYEGARNTVASALGGDADEVVFVRGATEGLNLLAHGLTTRLDGREVLVTAMEHHANLVPWQQAAARAGATLRAVPLRPDGTLELDALDTLLTDRTAVFAFVHASNSLGTLNPVRALCDRARAVGAVTVVDGCQAVPHGGVDVGALGCDAYVFSGHKVYGPTGIGAVWARRALWETLPPYQTGGEMIRRVTLTSATWNDLPHRFEAGTPHIAGAVGLAAALQWLASASFDVRAHEDEVCAYAAERLDALSWVRRIGTAAHRAPLVSFVVDGVHAHDVGTLLDEHGVAVRVGHHCTQPVMDHFDVAATVRASFGAYSTRAEVDRLVDGLEHVREVFA
jgi:cysteine desulfurase/selenocysteine lyase